MTRVFVRALQLEALIGVRPEETLARQPLIVDIEVEIAAVGWRHLADTVDYESLAEKARAIAAAGHIGLVESFARRLAEACLADPKVQRVRVRVEKPRALAPAAEAAGVEIILARE